jgi:3-hydroxyisobutyrate dehydrogenase-like beta-hydroxyacid dehydrogenase
MPDESRPVIGFIGLGRMGAPMCRRLLEAGHALVVHNRTPARAAPLVALGATVAATPAALAAASDTIITCLDTVAASESVFLGPHGIIANAGAGSLLIEHSTISPELAERVASTARGREIAFVDAPVSGGPEGAEQGTLAIMAGGDTDAFARALPILRAYGAIVQRMGDAGSGTRAKLVNQLLTFMHGAVAAESIALAERLGLNLDALAVVLRASFGQSRMLDRTLARVSAGSYDAGAALALYEKDLGIVAASGAAYDLQLPVTDAARRILDTARAAGLTDRDISALRLLYPDSSSTSST